MEIIDDNIDLALNSVFLNGKSLLEWVSLFSFETVKSSQNQPEKYLENSFLASSILIKVSSYLAIEEAKLKKQISNYKSQKISEAEPGKRGLSSEKIDQLCEAALSQNIYEVEKIKMIKNVFQEIVNRYDSNSYLFTKAKNL